MSSASTPSPRRTVWVREMVIDLRGPEEFDGALGPIAPALNLPFDGLPGGLIEIKAQSDKPVILVRKTDKGSARAAALLSDACFRNLRVLRGGMEQWHRDGLAVSDNGHVDQVRPVGGASAPLDLNHQGEPR